jgi:purine-nucleoside phosphorylase
MGSGMGIPSMGIYSYELFSFFGVERIVRVGTCGGYRADMELGDIVMAQASSTNSAWAAQYDLGGTFSAVPDFGMLEAAVASARRLGKRFLVGNTLCLDQFSKYHKAPGVWKPWIDMGIVATEMESYALYCNASALGKRALAMFTVSGLRLKDKYMGPGEKERSLDAMIAVALDSLL